METSPWIIAAGKFLAKCHEEIEAPEQIRRKSAETWLGIAKADLKRATEQVAHLKRCLAAELSQQP